MNKGREKGGEVRKNGEIREGGIFTSVEEEERRGEMKREERGKKGVRKEGDDILVRVTE